MLVNLGLKILLMNGLLLVGFRVLVCIMRFVLMCGKWCVRLMNILVVFCFVLIIVMWWCLLLGDVMSWLMLVRYDDEWIMWLWLSVVNVLGIVGVLLMLIDSVCVMCWCLWLVVLCDSMCSVLIFVLLLCIGLIFSIVLL